METPTGLQDSFRDTCRPSPEKCQSASCAGCDCQRDVTARICLFLRIVYCLFFFPLYLSLPRISRSDLWTRASTNAQLVYGHHGTDLFVGGILLLCVWTAQMGILMFLLLCEALFYLRSLRPVRNQAKLMWRKYFFKMPVLNSEL